MSALDRIKAALPGYEQHGKVFKALCPCHLDSKPSLEFKQGDQGVLLKCRAGCETGDVVEKLGLKMQDLFDETASAKPKRRGPNPIRELYDYVDEYGALLFQVARLHPKDFLQRHPTPEKRNNFQYVDEHGETRWEKEPFTWGIAGVRRPLYRLPRLIKARDGSPAFGVAPMPDPTVWVCEGEKDVHALERAGVLATCNPGGANQTGKAEDLKWLPEHSETLRRFHVILVRDNDEAGYAHVQAVSRDIEDKAASVRCVRAKTGKDAYDHLAAGHGLADFVDVDPLEECPDELRKKPKAKEPKGETQPDLIEGEDEEEPLGDLTDMGNAERLVAAHKGEICYCAKLGGWHFYDGIRWRLDETGHVMRLQMALAKYFWRRCFELPKDKRKPFLEFANRSMNRAALENALAVARSLPGVSVQADEFDQDPWVLNVLNGTLDLRTATLFPHEPGRMIRRLAPVRWDPEAECPLFKAHLSKFIPSEDVRKFLWRFAGYSLTGESASAMLFLHGSGRNGKSTIVETLKFMMGDYAKPLSTDILMRKRERMDAGAMSELADLPGVRMTASIETDEGAGLNEQLIKALTGGEELVAKLMHQNTFRFQPQFKMWMSGNHKPTIKGTDDGIWARVMLVPFTVQIAAADRIENFSATLRRDELSGILRWAVLGCLSYQKNGLQPPADVKSATEEYRNESDVMGMFLDQRTVKDPNLSVTVDALLTAYNAWAKTKTLREMNIIDFGKKIKAAGDRRGFEKRKTMGVMLVVGIGLADADQAKDPYEDE